MAIVPTSLKMTDELKERIARLAKETGETPHALMLRLLEERVTAAERHRRFIEDGKAAAAELRAAGKAYDADDVHRHLEDKVAGRRGRPPKLVKWRA